MKKIEKIEATKKPEQPLRPVEKKRVAAYVRVSTFHEEQLHSLEAQSDYFRKYITEHDNWELVDIYTDNGVSGRSVRNRQRFLQMIQDCMDGKIDMVITKSITRFARNTVDTLNVLKQLKKIGVGVYFHKENVWSLDQNGEFLITLLASFAQEESRSISENVKWSIRKRFENGIYFMPFKSFLGYDKGMVINEKEAVIVRMIFKMSLQGYSCYGISKYLSEMQIPSPMGKEKWYAATIKGILTNEKHKGDALLQKTFVVDFSTHLSKKNTGELPQYYIHNDHEAIIAPEIFDAVQKKLKEEFFSGKNAMCGLIKCGKCHKYYSRQMWHSTTYNDAVWKCYSYLTDFCGNIHIYEKSLYPLILKAWKHLLRTNDTAILACQEIVSDILGNEIDLKPYLCDPQLLDFDDLLLILKDITVSPKQALIFHFIDGSYFRVNYERERRSPFPKRRYFYKK